MSLCSTAEDMINIQKSGESVVDFVSATRDSSGSANISRDFDWVAHSESMNLLLVPQMIPIFGTSEFGNGSGGTLSDSRSVSIEATFSPS